MRRVLSVTALLLVPVLGIQAQAQKTPPWSKGANGPAMSMGYELQVLEIENVVEYGT